MTMQVRMTGGSGGVDFDRADRAPAGGGSLAGAQHRKPLDCDLCGERIDRACEEAMGACALCVLALAEAQSDPIERELAAGAPPPRPRAPGALRRWMRALAELLGVVAGFVAAGVLYRLLIAGAL